jgi:hypothetical protein
MIRIAPIDHVYSDFQIWTCVKRLGDFKPIDGAEYIVLKTRNAEPLIYRAVDGKIRSTGDTFVRWGISDDLERDLVRIPARR